MHPGHLEPWRLVCSIQTEPTGPLYGRTSIQVLNCPNFVKIQMEFLQAWKRGGMLLQIVSLWFRLSFTRCRVNHKFGLTSVLLKTCRLPTHHRSRSAASHLQADLPVSNPCPFDGASVLIGRQLEDTQFSYNHCEFLLWCLVTILSLMLQCMQFHLNQIQLW